MILKLMLNFSSDLGGGRVVINPSEGSETFNWGHVDMV